MTTWPMMKFQQRRRYNFLSDTVRVARLHLAGHILPEERPKSVAMNWEPMSDKRKQGRPEIKDHLQRRSISRRRGEEQRELPVTASVAQCPRVDGTN